ncbi:hypothetical protein O3M35_007684 [Rhynocoris fuscipes]|uniref:Protein fuzzy homolog n=1 Tax=Rhynocoris fuscipes TaxID=488301 RepID=A0AAW1DHK2_9HEMI
MGANIMCVTSSGGLPLFSRTKGNIEPLPFSVIGSLNGVHMFGKSHGLVIESTETKNMTVVWKEFESSITLIAVAYLNGQKILNNVLDAVFGSLVLFVGIDELKNIKNVERTKREMRACYPVIDKILECLDFGERNTGGVNNNILGLTEAILCTENESMLTCLESYVESVCSLFGCVTIENCIAVATDGWWELSHLERKLLSFLMSSNSNCTAFDSPVFLPCKSPNVPFRLVSVCLINSVWVSVLCGPTPDISSIEQICYQCWAPVLSTLRTALLTYPRNIPLSVQMHNSIFGLLLINIKFGKYVLSNNLNIYKKDSKSSGEVLKTFYYEAVTDLINKETNESSIETYWCSEYHKLHAIRNGDNIICVMYNYMIPTHTMRLISKETMTSIISLEGLEWHQ